MAFSGNWIGNNDRTMHSFSPASTNPETRHSETFAERFSFHRPSMQRDTREIQEGAIAQPTDKHNSVLDSATEKYTNEDSDLVSREEVTAEVRNLARQWTRQSTASEHGHPLQSNPDPMLDPNSEHFKPRAWTKAMLRLAEAESEHFRSPKTGVCFKNLSVHGFGSGSDFQKSVGNVAWQAIGLAKKLLGRGERRIDILRNFDGLVQAGEMLVVLGPPGSGCTTFLKTLAGETHGFVVDPESYINYQGISHERMKKNFRGEAIYTAEQDVHFPHLTVGHTLYFAARARTPKFLPGGATKHQYAEHMRDVIMATFGIRHTINTRVGNDYVRGVSGGERKRVSIAEAALSHAPLQLWDNSTRGLDSANAIEFCKNLRIQTEVNDVTVAVAIYQAPQTAYETFDKVILLYEGRQIFFGPTNKAKAYFTNMGFECPERQNEADFLTSMTSPVERIVKPGYENRVPRSPDEFAQRWRESPERQALLEEISRFEQEHPIGGPDFEVFKESRRTQQAKNTRPGSPYTLSYTQQIQLCLWRAFVQLKGDPSITLTQLIGNFCMALIISSVFYDLDETAGSFYSRSALLFFAIMMSAFGSALEILTRYAQRPIVEKHSRYALYHPSAEAFASMLCDMPYKITNTILFNLTIYFMTNLRRDPGAFFFFLLISFFMMLTMSMMFRGIASVSRTLEQAMAPAGLLMLALIIYTGFVIPTDYMLGWSRWINYLNPVAFGFEALMVNEFSGRTYPCVGAMLVPNYPGADLANQICSAVGAVPGQTSVDGDTYIQSAYKYNKAHRWRNFGILIAFMIALMVAHLVATEYIQAKKSKGEVLVFRRGHMTTALTSGNAGDMETAPTGNAARVEKTGVDVSNVIQKQTSIFQWRDVCYDIKIKGEPRRILDHVDGWVKPGTLTALMGVSGAGKTTLLDVLAKRVTMGVISGEMLVDGRQRDSSFQRKTGYVQQQDLHLQTSTVREALRFSAVLRQPASVPYQEKMAYVEEVVKILDMEEYADAVVGVPGEGLNVEQRKRLTIGVELAAKPQLLLFLDEPTSGLDSQTSWSILNLLEKLTKHGQAILCTIHQPSAMLFQRFDRLLFLAKGGKTVYFGPVGHLSTTLISYFEKNGADPCPPGANPAEWMLEVIGAAPGTYSEIDWPRIWRESPEYRDVQAELNQMKRERSKMAHATNFEQDKTSYREFAVGFPRQWFEVQKRVFEQHWRTPRYIYAKFIMCIAAGLFIGFSFFRANNTQQGLQNQMIGIFMLMSIFGQLVQQLMPLFVTQRSLYEVRERPSKAYSWQAFVISNVVADIPWSLGCSVCLYFCWYYPIGLWRNAEPSDAVAERGALMFLLILTFLLFTNTFAHMIIAAIDTAETGGNIANLLFSLCLIFCGVLVAPNALPGFWIFMYRVSPFTYLIGAMLATAVGDASVTCAANEYLSIDPPSGQMCAEYMDPYISTMGGYLQNGNATADCSYCRVADTNAFLAGVSVNPRDSWRNFGFMWIYIVFNFFMAIVFYWLGRVPKAWNSKIGETSTPVDSPAPEKNEDVKDSERTTSSPGSDDGQPAEKS
ncbi:uncharacterized protein Z518_11392 [Rhinocladiella mackenziei CBS 650.93]|uniref:Rhinocladiella mackenziei CBS 650.93 unplaced genomic scaffold supercont1.13, whole genome shotgun sequence n=1 Tax=Rhinocladiella mackenziei CBS 650.93 TaxID=1442369 RepID=A0A0D2IRN1_9EURO|nr:uncharacterized protein Z518_11392 [Rhinocladiella mackenziei CBS 650.93]KIW99404.1 hypothetical protein Z518_11392 [Rhinocladiella mackenziei CBS 650.93]